MKTLLLTLIILVSGFRLSAQPLTDSLKHPKPNLEKYFNPSLTEEQRAQFKNEIYANSQKIHSDSLDATAYLNRGAAYFNLGMYPYAISDFTKTIKLNPTIPEAYYNRGIAKARFTYNKEACLDIKKASELGLAPAGQLFNKKCGQFVNEIESPNKE